MQFKVPQDVQREDTIVGPLTLKQLIICGIGGGIAYLIYLTLAKIYFMEIWLPPVLFVALFTIAFAFVKIHNLSFFRYLLFLILHNILPRKRTWQKLSGDVYVDLTVDAKTPKKQKKPEKKKPTLSDVKELTKILDSHDLQKS